jgi:hypothetical protein
VVNELLFSLGEECGLSDNELLGSDELSLGFCNTNLSQFNVGLFLVELSIELLSEGCEVDILLINFLSEIEIVLLEISNGLLA